MELIVDSGGELTFPRLLSGELTEKIPETNAEGKEYYQFIQAALSYSEKRQNTAENDIRNAPILLVHRFWFLIDQTEKYKRFFF